MRYRTLYPMENYRDEKDVTVDGKSIHAQFTENRREETPIYPMDHYGDKRDQATALLTIEESEKTTPHLESVRKEDSHPVPWAVEQPTLINQGT